MSDSPLVYRCVQYYFVDQVDQMGCEVVLATLVNSVCRVYFVETIRYRKANFTKKKTLKFFFVGMTDRRSSSCDRNDN